jgi:hypothetical protein
MDLLYESLGVLEVGGWLPSVVLTWIALPMDKVLKVASSVS